jgi:hypothetical protein
MACRHTAVAAALTASEKFPVRIAYGFTKRGGAHVQAQAYIDGRWQWLRVLGSDVFVGESENFLVIVRYLTVDDVVRIIESQNRDKPEGCENADPQPLSMP